MFWKRRTWPSAPWAMAAGNCWWPTSNRSATSNARWTREFFVFYFCNGFCCAILKKTAGGTPHSDHGDLHRKSQARHKATPSKDSKIGRKASHCACCRGAYRRKWRTWHGNSWRQRDHCQCDNQRTIGNRSSSRHGHNFGCRGSMAFHPTCCKEKRT